MRVWIMDMKDNFWMIENKSKRFFGNSIQELKTILSNLNKNEYILFNGNLKKITHYFNENGLIMGEDYRAVVTRMNYVRNIRFLMNEKNICFRNFVDFFGVEFNGEIEENFKSMWDEIDDFIKVSGMKTFYKKNSMEDIIRQDWREFVDWEKNFKDQLTEAEFREFLKYVSGGFRYISSKFSNKIIRSKSFDVNSYYQYVWENFPMPIGKPIKDWKSGNCEHHLQLIKCRLKGFVKDGHLPILTRKQMVFDWLTPEEKLSELNNEIYYLTGDKFDLVNEFYNLTNIEIIEVTCFEAYQGIGFAEFNKKWHKIKNEIKNKALKKMIKICENKIIGSQASEKMLTVSRTVVDKIDGNSNITTKEKKIGVMTIPYIPLYLFITDFARDRMYLIGQAFIEDVVASNTDSFVFNIDLPDEEIADFIEVDATKLGAFKREDKGEYSYFKSPSHYLRAKSLDKAGDITIYRWSGLKDMTLYNLSLNDAIASLEAKQKEREILKISKKKRRK